MKNHIATCWKLIFVLTMLIAIKALADTPPPGTVKAKMFSGDGNTAVTTTVGGALNVNVTNSTSNTVNQGNAGSQSWLTQITNSSIPVTGTFWQSIQPVSGTLTCNAGSGTQNVSIQNASLAVTGTFWQATQPVSLATLPALTTGAATIGNVNVNGTVPVSGSFFQATQPVSLTTLPPLVAGSATIGNVNINGTVPISGSITATNTANGNPSATAPAQATQVGGLNAGNLIPFKVSGTGVVSVDGSASTQPVSGTFWQTTQPVSGTFFQATQPVSGAFFQATQPVSLISLPALATGANTIGAVNINGTVPISGSITATNTANGATGSAVPSQATQMAGSNGGNLIALKVSSTGVLSVDASGVAVPVTGTFWQTTQPISGTVVANAGTGTFSVDGSGHTQPVSGTFFQATQPVSAASLPLPTGAATAAKQPALGVAGTASSDVITVQGIASMTPLAMSASALPLPAGAATSALQSTINTTLGTPFQAGGSIGNTSFIATQATGTNLHAVIDSSALPTGGATSALQTSGNSQLVTIASNQTNGTQVTAVNNFPATQAISAASLPLPTGASTSANQATAISNQTNATQKTQIVDGSGNVIASTSNALNVAIGSIALPTGASTSALQTSGNSSLSSIDTKTPALGQTTMSGSRPVVIASDQSAIPVTGSFSASITDLTVTGQATQTAVVNNILTVASGATATTLNGYRSASVQVVSTGTAGTFIFEGSNDNVNFQALPVYSQLILTGTPITTAITASASQLVYTFPITTSFVRLRIATTITGGSIQAFSRFSSIAWVPAVMQIAQATAANLNVTAGTVTTVSTISSVTATTSVNTNADQASAAIVTTTTSAAKVLAAGTSVAFNINLTATSGSGQTYDWSLQTTVDGTNWTTVYMLPHITGSGVPAVFTTPFLNLQGIQYRYVETIAGSTPSFTRTITTNRSTQPGVNERVFYDTSMSGGVSAGSSGVTFNVEGLTNIEMIINSVAGTGVAPVLYAIDVNDYPAVSQWTLGVATVYSSQVATGSPTIVQWTGSTKSIRVRNITAVPVGALNFVEFIASNAPHVDDLGRTIANAPFTNAYATTNITTAAYVQLVASTSAVTNSLTIADTSGQIMILAIGLAGVEQNIAYIPAGGVSNFPINIPPGSRVSYKALTANATTGVLTMSFLN